MGLTNRERATGIYYAIQALFALNRKLRRHVQAYSYNSKELCELLDQLWPCAIGSYSNSSHWLTGPSSNGIVDGDDNNVSLWNTIIADHIECAVREPASLPNNMYNEFDPFDSFLNISGLLPEPYKLIFKVFEWTEQLSYYLRRYNDYMLNDLSDLNNLVAKIQGLCAESFVDNDIYAKAYLINRIATAVYSFMDNDVVDNWLKNQYICHHISESINGPLGIKELAKIHLKIVGLANQYRNNSGHKANYDLGRIICTLRLIGGEYHYRYKQRALIDMLSEKDWPKKHLDKIQKEIDKCNKIYEKVCSLKKQKTGTSKEIFYGWLAEWDEPTK